LKVHDDRAGLCRLIGMIRWGEDTAELGEEREAVQDERPRPTALIDAALTERLV
jgi:hypothetical protein